MILYFDSLITDTPLLPKTKKQLKDDIRKKSKAYAMPKKIDVAKYTLASYSIYPWSNVLIRYELDDKDKTKEFDKYIRSLFPKAHILYRRSDSQAEYIKSIKILNSFNDDWIFYAPNNDHPMIYVREDIKEYFKKLVKQANTFLKKHKFVSIVYSHYSTFINVSVKNSVQNVVEGSGVRMLDDNEISRIYSVKGGDFTSVQIVNKALFTKWFNTKNLGNEKIIRAESVRKYISIDQQIIIVPKKEVCAHFDGYLHMQDQQNSVDTDFVPPLFVPNGFFENNIKISYGYHLYRDGWVNINPCAKKYSFRDNKYGTDLKINLQGIPFFWLNHISQIDVNKDINEEKMKKCVYINTMMLNNPWTLKVEVNFKRVYKYWLQFELFRFNILLRKNISNLLKSTR